MSPGPYSATLDVFARRISVGEFADRIHPQMRRRSGDLRIDELLAGIYFELAEIAPTEGVLPARNLFTPDLVRALLFLLDESASPAPRSTVANNLRGSLGWLFPRSAWGDIRRRQQECDRWDPFPSARAAASSVRGCGEALLRDLRAWGLLDDAELSLRALLRDLELKPTLVGLTER